MGNKLIKAVVEATGLPHDPVQRELTSLLHQNGIAAEAMTIDDLREVMAEYLQSVFVEMKEAQN